MTEVYDRLLEHFGPQHWWPAESRLEVIIGAILTQQTAWKKVEEAIGNMKAAGLMDLEALADADRSAVAASTAPCGFYRTKPLRLKGMAAYIRDYYGDVGAFLAKEEGLRDELLSLDGIGPETADSILCYAGDRLHFVVDAYTRRIGRRMGFLSTNNYDDVQAEFHKTLPQDIQIYKEFHALLVKLGKTYCRSSPLCGDCPLTDVCEGSNGD